MQKKFNFAMADIPIIFDHNGKTYSGYFSEVTGMGQCAGSVWHLMVDKYYFGQLWIIDGKWRFGSNAFPDMAEMADYFGDYLTNWYE